MFDIKYCEQSNICVRMVERSFVLIFNEIMISFDHVYVCLSHSPYHQYPLPNESITARIADDKTTRNDEWVNDKIEYKGPLDPLRGDAPYQRVRDAAKDAMTAVFNNTTRAAGPSGISSRIEGFGTEAVHGSGGDEMSGAAAAAAAHHSPPVGGPGSVAHGTGGGPPPQEWQGTYGGAVPKIESGLYSTGKMVGFGNPAFAPAAPSLLDKMKEAAFGKEQPPQFRAYGQPDMYAAPIGGSQSVAPEPAPRYAENVTQRKRGQVGGGWDTAPVANVRASSGGVGGAPPSGAFSSGVAAEPRRERRTGNGELEGRIVDEITNPSGVRVLPRPDELAAFVEKCRSLDLFMISSLLDKKLAATVPATQLVGFHSSRPFHSLLHAKPICPLHILYLLKMMST
jgi:hypothetical protein